MFNTDEIYSVSDFLSLCNTTIENHIPICWLQGEISNLSRPASGHWYFSLKDSKGQIRCALFRLNQRNIKFNPENGMAVLVRAAPTLYQARGDFQIIVQHIEPTGSGNLNLAFEQLKNQLAKQGWFDTKHKKSLPPIPKTIGVISSSTGAVIRDIIQILNKRYPFANILLFDCVVQGEGAAQKLARAVQIADESRRCDVLILARGGGSLEDLWAFNEEVLARVVFNAKTPIISAVGHETDTTIADFVSDVRAPTPSAAAMLVAPDGLTLLNNVDKLLHQLIQAYQQNITDKANKLQHLKLRLPTPNQQFHFFAQKLDFLAISLQHQAKNNIRQYQVGLASKFARLKQHSPIDNIRHAKTLNQLAFNQLNQHIQRIIAQKRVALDAATIKLKKNMAAMTLNHKNQLSIHVNSLHHLSPLSTLTRGYSITKNTENKVLSCVSNIKLTQTIITRLADGNILSTVDKIEKI